MIHFAEWLKKNGSCYIFFCSFVKNEFCSTPTKTLKKFTPQTSENAKHFKIEKSIMPQENGVDEKKRYFVIKHVFHAFISLLVLFGLVILFKKLYFDHNPEYWLEMFYGNSLIVHMIYVGSEVLFGLFPPELFMVWAYNAGNLASYILNILFFAAVSMGAGHLAFWIGRLLAKKIGKKIRKMKFVEKQLPTIKKFGGVIILISALTPLPWATISLIMGIIEYKYRYYSLFALARILRFVINGFLIYQTGNYFF